MKTLEDLEKECEWNFDTLNSLRQSVIEDVKEFEKEKNYVFGNWIKSITPHYSIEGAFLHEFPSEKIRCLQSKIDYIIVKNNLTKEDLK